MDTDRVFACPQLATSRALATRTPTYGFEFVDPDAPTLVPYYSARPAGAAHTRPPRQRPSRRLDNPPLRLLV
ncbi:hypothetical protein [Nocardia brasiliensis]|uniref:hypothetical protein n=1 Tax=Nocardia brasiliensis TaxID=37326 RepID=UPI003672BF36